MKVMLDAVFNHIGVSSTIWQDVVVNGEKSRYKDWFHIRRLPITPVRQSQQRKLEEQQYETFAFAQNMPKFDTSNPLVQEYLLQVATYWIKEFDIDGWRLDVANEVDHHFWKLFHKAVLKEKPDVYIVGEIWHSSQNWLNGDEFHAVMNYALTNYIRDFFLLNKYKPQFFVDKLSEQMMLYRQNTNQAMFNLLDSHDTARILSMAKGNKEAVKAALVCLFLQAGSPCIYYGTEVGLMGEGDPDCRRVMPWKKSEQDLDMLAFVKSLIKIRRKYYKIITFGTVEYSVLNDGERQFAITVSYNHRKIHVVFNMGESNCLYNVQGYKVLLTNQVEQESDDLVIQPNGCIVLYK